jgi:hypothetical protein
MAIGAGARTCRPLGSSNVLIADDSGKSFWGIAASNFAGPNKKGLVEAKSARRNRHRRLRVTYLSTQIGVNLFRFLQQIWHVSLSRLDDSRQPTKLGHEFFAEFPLLLISPSLFQLVHLRCQHRAASPHFFGEQLQVACELAELFGIDYGLTHRTPRSFQMGQNRLLGSDHRPASQFSR